MSRSPHRKPLGRGAALTIAWTGMVATLLIVVAFVAWVNARIEPGAAQATQEQVGAPAGGAIRQAGGREPAPGKSPDEAKGATGAPPVQAAPVPLEHSRRVSGPQPFPNEDLVLEIMPDPLWTPERAEAIYTRRWAR